MLLCIMGTLLLSIVTGLSLSLKREREPLLPSLAKHCFKLEWLLYYRCIQWLQTIKKREWERDLGLSVDEMLEIQLMRSMICHVSNMRWNTKIVCLVASDIVYRVMLVIGKDCGAVLCNVTTLMDRIWWTVMIAPIIQGEVCPIARYTTSTRALMVKSVTTKRLVHDGHWPVAGNGRLIAGYRSISDRTYRMVSLGYVFSGLGRVWVVSIGLACKFMVMFLQFAQRQKHCCLF